MLFRGKHWHVGNLNAEHALVSVHTDDYSHTLASCFQRILETYLACIFNKHGPIDVAKGWIALTENEIWVCMHVYDLKSYQHFPPAFLEGLCDDWTSRLFQETAFPDRSVTARCVRLSTSRGILLALCCAVTEYVVQWPSPISINIMSFFSEVCEYGWHLCGSWSTRCFSCGLTYDCSLNATVRQLSGIVGH